MIIREYRREDETQWVRCRLISFLDCSYFDDIKKCKEIYEHNSICLVAEDEDKIVGFIDLEYETKSGQVCYLKGPLGACIWNLGVLPEYRHKHIAALLWQEAEKEAVSKGVKRFEVWTQDDAPANAWYKAKGFQFVESYLNCFVYGDSKDNKKSFINHKNIGKIYGIRSLNFEAPIDRKDELSKICDRIHEVRLYELKL